MAGMEVSTELRKTYNDGFARTEEGVRKKQTKRRRRRWWRCIDAAEREMALIIFKALNFIFKRSKLISEGIIFHTKYIYKIWPLKLAPLFWKVIQSNRHLQWTILCCVWRADGGLLSLFVCVRCLVLQFRWWCENSKSSDYVLWRPWYWEVNVHEHDFEWLWQETRFSSFEWTRLAITFRPFPLLSHHLSSPLND